MDYNCYLISNKPHMYEPIRQSILPETLNFFDGSNFESFSKLVNTCVASCPSETVILMSDKVMPKQEHVKKIISLLDEGYGFVALYRFAFFGFRKELFRRIGTMDQHFLGGGGEDDDFYIRLKEGNISCYITEEVDYTPAPTTWGGYSFGKEQLIRKWGYHKKQLYIKRHYSESDWGYNLGPSTGETFMSYDKSHINAKYVSSWSKKIVLGLYDTIPSN